MFTKQTIKDVDLKGKTVLLRADYNVPLQNGKITDDYRIKMSLPTVKYLHEHANKLIICSHLGRPKSAQEKEFSLAPVAKRLSELLDKKVEFVDDCVGKKVSDAAKNLPDKGILLLENVRFYEEEGNNDKNFAKKLASVADVFVQDGFGVVHRDQASVTAVTEFLPSVAGLLVEKEADTITNAMQKPERPLMAIVGGAKISDKIELLDKLIPLADVIALGGAMANPFLAAQGHDVAKSLIEKTDIPLAKEIIKKAEAENKKRRFALIIPHDVVAARAIDKTAPTRIVELSTHTMADIQNYPKRVPAEASKLNKDEMILDIGPFSASQIVGAIQLVKTVIWNGALGVTETPSLQGPVGPTAHGTHTVVEALLGDFGNKPFTIVGGGDTVGYVESQNLVEMFGHVSTGGGASLELMSGHKLPGVEALLDKK